MRLLSTIRYMFYDLFIIFPGLENVDKTLDEVLRPLKKAILSPDLIEQFKIYFKYSRVWNKRSPLNKHSPLENLGKRISVAPFFTLYYEVRNKAVAPGKKS